MSLGPAPTPQRELVVVVLTVIFFAIVLAKVELTATILVAMAALAGYLVIRWIVGVRRWSRGDR